MNPVSTVQKLKPTPQQTESGFILLLSLAFASLFFGQALIHITAVLFIVWLIITHPRLPWIPAFWWLLGFASWEWISNFSGPYHGDGIEGGGISYHFLIIFLPLCITTINHSKLLTYITIGALASAALIWTQSLIGVDLNNSPLRIDWEGGELFKRPPGFNSRPWETQFIHSMIMLTVLSQLDWKKTRTWIAGFALSTGIILPQIRAVIAAFVVALGLQLIFSSDSKNTKLLKKRLAGFVIITLVSIGTIATLRPDFTNTLATGNGRDKIFPASFEIFSHYQNTGIGGGKHFKDEYQQAWNRLELPRNNGIDNILYNGIGHAHNDILLLLTHHGWPALLLWLGFVLHSLNFVWKHGEQKDKILYLSLITMHHVAGLSETYLDYSNTTYTILLCYGLALHRPYKKYKQHYQKT